MPVAQKFLEFVLSENAQKLWMLRDTDPEGPQMERRFEPCKRTTRTLR